jgi:glycerol 3-phosphatase-2
LSIVRAVASAVWRADGRPLRIEAADDRARDALRRWSLVHAD